MEEEKAAAYYAELTRKGEGAARFKQGLGFSSTSNTTGNSNDARGSALVSSSSFLSSFVRASSPSKTTEFEKQAQLQTIQNKLKKKPKDNKDYGNTLSSRVSKGKTSRSRSPSREKCSSRRSRSPSRRRSRSRSRDKERHLRHSKNWDAYWSKRSRSRSRSRDRDKYSERERQKEKQRTKRSRSVDRRPEKVVKDRAATVDYSKLIEGYENMTPAERVKAKMKLQLSESVRKDETKSMGSGWERFDFNKDAPLDDNEIEAVEDDGALVNHIGKSFRFSTVETRMEEQIKAAHDEAIFGAPTLLPLAPSTETDDEANGKTDISEIAPATSLISGQALAMQQGSWRDRARRS